MKYSKILIFFSVVFIFNIFFIGCNKKSFDLNIKGSQYIRKKIPEFNEDEIVFEYKIDNKRDPMVSLVSSSGKIVSSKRKSSKRKKSAIDLFINSLYLSGIISEEVNGRKKIYASLGDKKGRTYFIKDGYLINQKGSRVQGIKGMIKGNKVLILRNNKVVRTLKMRK